MKGTLTRIASHTKCPRLSWPRAEYTQAYLALDIEVGVDSGTGMLDELDFRRYLVA